jgi:shikimate kinase
MKYFICGFMGAGKTTALESLKLNNSFFGYSFYDLDTEIAKRHNVDVTKLGDLIGSKGFEWFRSKELEIFKDIMKSEEKVWISLGGGALSNPAFLEMAKTIKGYWLNTDFDTCLSRIKGDSNRPLEALSTDDLRSLYKDRLVSYEIFDIFPYCGAE